MTKRYYFGLIGAKTLEDPLGLAFDSDVAAFHCAADLAKSLADSQPALRGSTCVVVTQNNSHDVYYVSVGKDFVSMLFAATAILFAAATFKNFGPDG